MQICLDFNSIFYFFLISGCYVMTLICFVDRNVYSKHKRMHHFWFGELVFVCVLALIRGALALKIYAVLSVVVVIVVEAAIKKRREKAEAVGTAK